VLRVTDEVAGVVEEDLIPSGDCDFLGEVTDRAGREVVREREFDRLPHRSGGGDCGGQHEGAGERRNYRREHRANAALNVAAAYAMPATPAAHWISW
jgi:hypothetical protein